MSAEAQKIVSVLRARPASPMVAGVARGFRVVPGGLSPRFEAEDGDATARVVLPARATAAAHLEDAKSGVGVDISLSGARDVAAQAADGYVAYPHALDSGATVLHRALPTGTEDFVSFETRPSKPEIAYGIDLGSGVSGLRLVAGTLEMLDAEGTPRLHVAPPYIVGADGTQTDATLAVERCEVDESGAAPWGRPVTAPGGKSCTLRVSWDDTAVAYPAVLDPRWTTTGSMTVARQDHAATLLSTGKVLVTGGRSTSTGTTGLASAELYDRTTATWAATGSMTGGRWSHTATQLNTNSNTTTSGKVLISGGLNGTTSQNTAQLYSPTAGTWVAAANLNAARHLHTATLLPSGNVLLAGGLSGTTVLNTAAIYNPASGTGTWTAVATNMASARRSHTATLLTSSNASFNNKVLIVGGNSGGTTSLTSVQLFDTTALTWSTTTALATAREAQTATILANGNVLIAGGKSGTTTLGTTFVFTIPASGTAATWVSAGTMTALRSGHTATLLPSAIVKNGQVLVAGGSNGTSTLATAELWNGTTTWTATTALATPVQGQTATLLSNNMILLAGGANGTTTVGTASLYDGSFSLACTSNTQCATGFCTNGVCCDTACNGGCGVCNLAGKVGTCSAATNTTVCRAQNGACDVQEKCNGTSLTCPTDAISPLGTVCRGSNGPCDVPETCDGTTKACPADGFAATTVVCRASTGTCDAAETCSGTSAACPADGFASATTVCRPAAGGCDAAETCTGTSPICPPDHLSASGTVCRAAQSICDLAETCSGASATCPTDVFAAAGTTCGAASSGGTAPVCGGSTGTCPVASGTSDVLGFEALADWAFDPSATASIVGLNAGRTQGESSLEVTAQNYARLNSAPMSSIGSIGSIVLLDIQLPTSQANPSWYGDAQMFVSSPSLGINNVPMGDVPMTGLALGTWQTLAFQMPPATVATIAHGIYSDLTFAVVLNVPYNETGHYLLDNIRSIPDVVPSLLGIAQDGATLKAVFDYLTTSSTPVNIPYGTANGLTNQNGFIAAPPEVPPTTFVSTTHAPFVATLSGSILTWTIGSHSATATTQSTKLTVTTLPDGTHDATLPDGRKVNLDSVPPADPTPQPEPSVGTTPFLGTLTGELSVTPSGAAMYTVPISIPPGIAGIAPQLALVYNSQGGDGIAGRGWQLSGLSMIHRCPKTALKDGEAGPVTMKPLSQSDPDGICIDGKKLYEDPPGSGNYRPESQDFSQIVRLPSGAFQVTTKTGEIRSYGSVNQVKDASGQIGIWPLDLVTDVWGNYFTVQYNHGNQDFLASGLLVTRIDYTGHNGNNGPATPTFSFVSFDYEPRNIARTIRLGAEPLPVNSRLKTITTPRGTYSLFYATDEFTTDLLIQIGYCTGATPPSAATCLPPLKFAWGANHEAGTGGQLPQTYGWPQVPDFAVPTINGVGAAYFDQLQHGSQFVDLDVDGLPDLVVARNGQVGIRDPFEFSYRNSGHDWIGSVSGWHAIPTFLSTYIGSTEVPTGVRFADLDGDGKLDIIQDTAQLTCPGGVVDENCFVCPVFKGGTGCGGAVHTAIPAVWLNRVTSTGGHWEYHPEFENIPPVWKALGLNFNGSQSADTTPHTVVDINGDGRADIVQVNYANGSPIGAVLELRVLLNTPNGWVSELTGTSGNLPVELSIPGTPPFQLRPHIRDINRDGLPDLVADTYVVDGQGNLDSYSITFLNKDGVNGTSFFPTPSIHAPPGFDTQANQPAKGVSFGDLDGDGFYDLVSFASLSNTDPTQFQVGIGMNDGSGPGFVSDPGNGFREPLFQLAATSFFLPDDFGYALLDANGDGLVDLVRNHGRADTGHGELLRNDGRGWQHFASPSMTFPNGAVPMVPDDEVRKEGAAFVDLNGDGLTDVIKDASAFDDDTDGFASRAWINSYQKPEITQFPNQLAPLTNVGYLTITTEAAHAGPLPTYTDSGALDPGTTYLPVPMRVVHTVKKDTGVGLATTTYQYSDIRGSAFGYGPQGFKTMTVTDPSGLVTTSTLSQLYPFTGSTIKVERNNGLGQVQKTTTAYCLAGDADCSDSPPHPQPPRTSFFIHPASVQDIVYVPTEIRTETASQFDAFGNPTLGVVVVSTPDGNASTGTGQIFQTTTFNQYGSPGSLQQRMGKPSQTQVTYHRSAPAPSSNKIHTTQFEYQTIFGALALTKKKVEPGAGEPIELHTAYDYDQFGNVITTTTCATDFAECTPGSPGPFELPFRTNRASYRATDFNAPSGSGLISVLGYGDGRFPVRTMDALSHESYSAYDPLLGVLVQSTDPNGVNSCETYDLFGNQTSQTERCGSAQPMTATINRYVVTGTDVPLAKVVTVTHPPTGGETLVYSDAISRTLVTRGRQFNGAFADSTTTSYDVLGRVASQSKPHFVGDVAYASVPTYDAFSRVTNVSDALGPLDNNNGPLGVGITTTDYAGFLITTGHTVGGLVQNRSELKNVVGKVTGVNDTNGTATSYSYDADGNLTDVAQGTGLVHVDYDIRGRKTASSDADLGSWTYTYDGFGDVITQKDAKQQVTTMTYDVLGRMLTKTDARGTAEWIYDGALGAGIGKLSIMLSAPDPKLNGACAIPPEAAVTGGDRAIRSYRYTQFGEVQTVTDCADGDTFATAYEYDVLGRQSLVRYPAVHSKQLAVGYHYSSFGFLQYLTDESSDYSILWQAKARNALGQVTDEQTRNGVETISTRNPATGWLLASLSTAHSDGNKNIQAWKFGYDEAGNLLTRDRADEVVDAPSGEIFTYDGLNRLQTSRVKVGPTPFYDVTETYAYDVLGNLKQKGGKMYTYGSGCSAGARAAGPHAVCTVGGSTPFSYDDNGNMTVSGTRTMQYNPENKPVEITSDPMPSQGNDTGTVEFMYGADGNRVVQQVTSGTTSARTVYIGLGGTGKSMYERTTTGNTGQQTGQAITHVNFIYTGDGNAFAVRVMADDGTVTANRYFNFDHLGSTTAISDDNGHIANATGPDAGVLGYDPWGARRNPDGQPASPASFNPQVGHREFTGHEAIPDVGLVNMNGRVYDPVIGRFLSPDPNIQFANNLQSYNRYSYVVNNPLSYTDPTGYDFAGLSTNTWINIGMIVAGVTICTLTELAGCGVYVMVAITTVNVTSAVLAGATTDQVAGYLIWNVGFGLAGGYLGGQLAASLGGDLAAQMFGGAFGGALSAALSTTMQGQDHLGWNMLEGASIGALTAGVTTSLQPTARVSEASAAAAEGGGGSGESVAEGMAREQASGAAGWVESQRVSLPDSGGDDGSSGTLVSYDGKQGGFRSCLGSSVCRGALRSSLTVDVATANSKAVYYSGAGAQEAAIEHSQNTNSYTIQMKLETTSQGKALLGLLEGGGLPSEQRLSMWAILSSRFAQQTTGETFIFIGSHTDEDSFYWNYERPVLRFNQSLGLVRMNPILVVPWTSM